jgi:peptidyl-prolyl cis-trans isomerase SurA
MSLEGIVMKKQLLIITSVLFSVCMAEAKTVDRILVKVNDDIITQSELNRTMTSARQELAARFSGARLEQELQKAEKEALDFLIEEKLLYQKAVEMEYHTRAEPRVAAYTQRVIKERNLKDTDELEALLIKQGSSLREFREEVQKQIAVEELKNDFVGSRISLLQSEIDKYYKDHIADYTYPQEVELSEIIIPVEGGRQEAENRANDLYGRLQKGEPFPALASQYSKGTTADRGGRIGKYFVKKLSPEMAKAIANYKEGENTKPQLMKEGYAIFHIDSFKDAAVRPISEVQDEIREEVGNAKFQPEFERFLAQLKEDAYIEYFSDIK